MVNVQHSTDWHGVTILCAPTCANCGGPVKKPKRGPTARLCVSCMRPPTTTATCKHCGVSFESPTREGRPHLFCGDQCRAAYGKARSQARQAARATLPNGRVCVVCATPLLGTQKRHCGAAPCRSEISRDTHRKNPIPTTQKHCAVCGVAFVGRVFGGANTCSGKCRNVQYRARRRSIDSNRRGARHDPGAERVVWREVMERDGWVCQICGRKTKKSARPGDPLAASIDHIVPLSRGGAHSYRNTQCACMECNTRKGNRTAGQLRLF